jgi:hypothetical protein
MYRIQATCRRHKTNQRLLAQTVLKCGWVMNVVDDICRIEQNFKTINEAKEGRVTLETEIYRIEKKIKPDLGFQLVFSNAYWVTTPVS